MKNAKIARCSRKRTWGLRGRVEIEAHILRARRKMCASISSRPHKPQVRFQAHWNFTVLLWDCTEWSRESREWEERKQEKQFFFENFLDKRALRLIARLHNDFLIGQLFFFALTSTSKVETPLSRRKERRAAQPSSYPKPSWTTEQLSKATQLSKRTTSCSRKRRLQTWKWSSRIPRSPKRDLKLFQNFRLDFS